MVICIQPFTYLDLILKMFSIHNLKHHNTILSNKKSLLYLQ